jgi:predicted AlkP superfamily phosphohydrolase/phosphomutase
MDSGDPLAEVPLARRHGECLDEGYRCLDGAIGRFMESLPSDTVIVLFSPYGTAARCGELASTVVLSVLLHRWSFDRPMLQDVDQQHWRKSPHPLIPTASMTWHQFLLRQLADGPDRQWRQRLAIRHDSLYWRLYKSLKSILKSKAPMWSGFHWQVASWYRKKWRYMRAFDLQSLLDGFIRINLAGRGSSGIVQPDNYYELCGELERFLRECRNPRNGNPAVIRIRRSRPEDLTGAQHSHPDLSVERTPGLDAIEHPTIGMIGPFPFRRTGEHTPQGFALFSGPGIQRADLGTYDVPDIPATLLALLGHPLPAQVEGRPILNPIGSKG